MLAERRMLARFVLPALRAACRARRLSLEWVLCGAGSPAAQRVLIQKLGQIAEKRGYARDIAGCGGACSKA